MASLGPVLAAGALRPPNGHPASVLPDGGGRGTVRETTSVSSGVVPEGGPEMLQFQQMAETHSYRYPVEQAVREREARAAGLLTDIRHVEVTTSPRNAPRRSLVPRIAAALGLF